MSEKISKISVDGVVYDIASTGGGEVPGDIQEQLSALENKVTEEASAREEGDAKLSEKIESEASRVDGMVNQINENVASSIETLNNNLVQAIETINNGIAAEVTNREEGDAKLSEKIESEASRVDGMVNQINENVASSIETLNNNLVQAIETINNGIAAEVTNREEGDAKLQAAIDELAEKVNGEGADLTELEGKIEKNAADIATVNNNLVEAVNNINKNVADGFSTINGGLNNEIRPELEKAVKYEDTATEQNPGRKTIFLNNHDNICGKTTDGSAVNIAMVSKWNKVDLGSSSVEINLNGSAERPTYNDSKQIALLEDIEAAKEGLISYKVLEDGSKTIELANGDSLSGVNSDGVAGFNLAKVTPENKVEIGSAGMDLNLVGSEPRPLFNGSKGIALSEDLETKAAELQDNINLKASQSDLESYMSATDTKVSELEEKIGNVPTKVSELENDLGFQNEAQVDGKIKEAIAAIPPVDLTPYVSDVAGLSNTLEALNATVQILQSKVDVLTKTNTEVVSVDGSAGELKDSSKDYIVSGSINENAEIVGKSISLKSIKVSDNARLKLNAGDVEAKDLNISGSFPKANGNTVISVNNAEFIVFKDMVFDASEVYNGIEIGLASNSVLPKNILFDNCKFQGEFSNNAILVFGTQDNAIITLNNCYFEKISNALRLSNKSNASGVVVNINNCTVDQWETRAPWQGFLICEDYTNKTEEEVNANNLFGDGKITVNFNNLVHAGVKINPADPASVCGTKNESQVVMVCQDAVAGPEGDYCLSYDAAKFPVVSFK
jgi:hypothetical protein